MPLLLNDITYSAHLTATKLGLWKDVTKDASSITLAKLASIATELRYARLAATSTAAILETRLRDHLASVIIKTLDLAGALGYDMEEAITNKLEAAKTLSESHIYSSVEHIIGNLKEQE